MPEFDLMVDFFPLIAALLVALTCGLLGNFLVLRQQSLMGDAISHAILPGLVLGLVITTSMGSLVMLIGAAIASLIAIIAIELIKKYGRIESGAAMGVVFCVMFALGVLLLKKLGAEHTHINADAMLYGQLETLFWLDAPSSIWGLLSWQTLMDLPRQLLTLIVLLILTVGFIILFYKELRIASFDPALASIQGINAQVMHYALMTFVAAATVASFEAVGSILVITMLIAPAATARLFTDHLQHQILWSIIIAVLTACAGYFAATWIPHMFGAESVNAAGSMTVVAGLFIVLAIIASPSHGLWFRAYRRRKLATQSALDDLLTALWRLQETQIIWAHKEALQHTMQLPIESLCRRAEKANLITCNHKGEIRLTETGLNYISRHPVQRTQPEKPLPFAQHNQPDLVSLAPSAKRWTS